MALKIVVLPHAGSPTKPELKPIIYSLLPFDLFS
jgi:hypothetical protein